VQWIDRVGARYYAVIGENEFKDKKIWVKDLMEKKEIVVSWEEF